MIIDADTSNIRVTTWDRPKELPLFDGSESALIGDTLNHLTTMSGRIRRLVGEGTICLLYTSPSPRDS